MFYDTRFSHVSRFEFLKAHPRVHCDLRYARVFIVEKIDFAERNKGITAYTRKSVRMGYDVRGTEGEVEKRKGRRTKRKEQKRTQKRAPELVPFAFIYAAFAVTRHYIVYPLRPTSFCLLLFLLPRVNLSCFLFLVFPFPVFGTALSIARRMFVPTMLYHPAIISHTCHSPSVSLFRHSLSSLRPSHTPYPFPLTALSRGLL